MWLTVWESISSLIRGALQWGLFLHVAVDQMMSLWCQQGCLQLTRGFLWTFCEGTNLIHLQPNCSCESCLTGGRSGVWVLGWTKSLSVRSFGLQIGDFKATFMLQHCIFFIFLFFLFLRCCFQIVPCADPSTISVHMRPQETPEMLRHTRQASNSQCDFVMNWKCAHAETLHFSGLKKNVTTASVNISTGVQRRFVLTDDEVELLPDSKLQRQVNSRKVSTGGHTSRNTRMWNPVSKCWNLPI